MFTCSNHLTVQHVRLANRLFLDQLFIYQLQRFRAVARATVSRNSFVKSKYSFSFGGRLLGVNEAMLVIARLNVVIGEFFCGMRRCAAIVSSPFEAFCGEAVQAAAADRV